MSGLNGTGGERFADVMANERNQLSKERESLVVQRAGIDAAIGVIERELRAIDVYEAAKNGKATSSNGVTRATRARRGSKREVILATVRDSNGLSRGELLEQLGVKGDKSGEMSVSNALTALTKSGQLAREGGKYVFPAAA